MNTQPKTVPVVDSFSASPYDTVSFPREESLTDAAQDST